MKGLKIFMIFASAFIFTACATYYTAYQKPPLTVEQQYAAAMKNATYPQAKDICDSLFPIDKTNKKLTWDTINGEAYVLCVSLKNDVSFYNNDASGFCSSDSWQIWVTAAPQLLDRMAGLKYDDAETRLKQLLGLPPHSTYKHFVEFWVKPSDLFRPCPDKEIDDKTCNYCFETVTDSAYYKWYYKTRVSRSYPCELESQYPWTGIGYTYDWSPDNPSHVGLSEYVIPKFTNVVVEKKYTIAEYLAKIK